MPTRTFPNESSNDFQVFSCAPDVAVIIESPFRPAWWLRNCHAQTIWPALFRRSPHVETGRERLRLPDNDFIDLDWTTGKDGPVVIVMHGLEGSIHSQYAKGLLSALHRHGYRAVLMHFRGCSGEHNLMARSYHSGETTDLRFVIASIRDRFPDSGLALVGFSLGGNVVLKYLGESRSDSDIDTAVAVSVPFDLAEGARRLNRGFSKLYQWHLLNRLQNKVVDKFRYRDDAPFDLHDVTCWNDFSSFDTHVTAALHGFRDSNDYYSQSSSRPFLRRIETPTLILHSLDDPFLSPEAIPDENEISNQVTLELSKKGGHVGFISGKIPWRPRYWVEERVPEFLNQQFAQRRK